MTDTNGLLAHLRTEDVARDLDRLRAAVGDVAGALTRRKCLRCIAFRPIIRTQQGNRAR